MLEIIRLHRRALHKIPEIGFALPKTHAYLLRALEPTGAAIETVAQSGVLAFFDAGQEETIAFRADMDALMVDEPMGCTFQSEHAGQMHACGHDAHMATLLALAEWVKENLSSLPRNVLLIFQPAEESGGGAEKIVQSGALEKYSVRQIYAMHVNPALPAGQISSQSGAFMATSAEIHMKLRGKASHAARWREGCDALLAGADVVHQINEFERSLPKDMPHLLKLCCFRSGTSTNVIADLAQIDGTVRAFSRENHAFLKSEIHRIAQAACARYDVRADVAFSEGYPPVINDSTAYAQLLAAIGDMQFVEMCEPDLTAEDFSFYLDRVPGLMFYLGLGTGEPLHSPLFHLDERALLAGLSVFERLAARTV